MKTATIGNVGEVGCLLTDIVDVLVNIYFSSMKLYIVFSISSDFSIDLRLFRGTGEIVKTVS